ncbi:MAG: TrkA C-terminal domain-containing protein [Chloroflexi bacterium]|nr:TrkA C-terminal domain-containing protein [Chloroflexota bacterium]
MGENLLILQVPPDSSLVGQTLRESQLGQVMGLTVLGRLHDEQIEALSATNDTLQAGDTLLVQGLPDDLATLTQLATLELEQTPVAVATLETEQVGLVQATLSPYTALVGQNLARHPFPREVWPDSGRHLAQRPPLPPQPGRYAPAPGRWFAALWPSRRPPPSWPPNLISFYWKRRINPT